MKILLIIIFSIYSYTTFAQNRLNSLYSLELGNNIRTDDIQLKKWIDSLLKMPFISDLQNSTSKNNDNKFVSFKLISKNNTQQLNFPNTPISLVVSLPNKMKNKTFASKTINVDYSDEIQAYTHLFSPEKFEFTYFNFYSLGCTVYRLTDAQIIAHTLNFMIDFDETNNSKYNKFIEKINWKKRYKIPFLIDPQQSQVDTLLTLIKLHTTDVQKLIYDVFIKDKSEKTTQKNLTYFFKIINSDIIENVNKLINLKMKINFEESQLISIPNTWIQKTDSSKNENTYLKCSKIDYLFNRVNHEMIIDFQIQSKDSLIIISGSERCSQSPLKPLGDVFNEDNKLKTKIKKITLIINRKEIEISIQTEDYELIDVYSNKFY